MLETVSAMLTDSVYKNCLGMTHVKPRLDRTSIESFHIGWSNPKAKSNRNDSKTARSAYNQTEGTTQSGTKVKEPSPANGREGLPHL